MRVDQSSGYPRSRVRGRTRGRTVRGSRITGSQQPSDMLKDWKIEGSVQDIPFSSIPGVHARDKFLNTIFAELMFNLIVSPRDTRVLCPLNLIVPT